MLDMVRIPRAVPTRPDRAALKAVLVRVRILGDYVLSGGELPAMVLIDTIVRLLPGALGDEKSAAADSFGPALDQEGRLLDYPHYTRPPDWMGLEVPPVLLSGDHAKIAAWRAQQSRERTAQRRPDLLTGSEHDT